MVASPALRPSGGCSPASNIYSSLQQSGRRSLAKLKFLIAQPTKYGTLHLYTMIDDVVKWTAELYLCKLCNILSWGHSSSG
eukprot:scaffold26931_cov20-Prasinocladus_malaysianus.AAC.1